MSVVPTEGYFVQISLGVLLAQAVINAEFGPFHHGVERFGGVVVHFAPGKLTVAVVDGCMT